MEDSFRSKIKTYLSTFSYAKFKQVLIEELTASQNSNRLIAASFAVGLFFALSPFWGFHTILALALAILFRLNKVIVLLGVNVSSIPPLVPAILFMAYQSGSVLITGSFTEHVPELDNLSSLGDQFYIYFIGALASGIALAVLSFFILTGTLSVTRTKPQKSQTQ